MALTSPPVPRLRKMFPRNRLELRAASRPTKKAGPLKNAATLPRALTQNRRNGNRKSSRNLVDSGGTEHWSLVFVAIFSHRFWRKQLCETHIADLHSSLTDLRKL